MYGLIRITEHMISSGVEHTAAVEHDRIGDVLKFVSSRLTTTTPTTPLPAAPRQQVCQPLKLRRQDVRSERQRENHDAIGGMKAPRKSLKMVPGHRAIGRDVANILEKCIASVHAYMMLSTRPSATTRRSSRGHQLKMLGPPESS